MARDLWFFSQPRGKLTFTPTDPPRTFNTYVYQRVRPGLGNVTAIADRSLQLRLRVVPRETHTTIQEAYRARFAAAVSAWHSLDISERRSLNKQAAPLKISGINLWVRRWARAHPI